MLQSGKFMRGRLSSAIAAHFAETGPTLLAHYINTSTAYVTNLPTETRTTTTYAADWEGVYRPYTSGEVAITGGRLVRNLVTDTDVSNAAAWNNGANITVTSGVEDKDGGSGAYTLTAGAASANLFTAINFSTSASRNHVASCWIRRRTGTGTVEFLVPGGYQDVTSIITSSWQRITFSAVLAGAEVYLGWRITTSGDEIDVCFPQNENVTGRSDTTTPSEYVSSDDGMKTFSTANGNTLDGNTVVEATGSALSPAPTVVTHPAATNSCAYSQDLTGTGWGGTATTAQDQVDIFGNANTAWTVTDSDGVNSQDVSYPVTIPDDSNTHSVRAWFKKTTSAASFPGVSIVMSGGTGAINVGATVDTDAGALTDQTSSGPTSSSISDDGDYWRVTISHANNGTGNTSIALYVSPAVNTDASGTWLGSTTGSCVIDQCEIHLNSTHAVVHALAPIPTAGASATSNATEPVTTVNHADSGGLVTFVLVHDHDKYSNTFSDAYISNPSGAQLVYNSTSGQISVFDGTNFIHYNTTYSAGDVLKVGMVWSASAGSMALYVNGSLVGEESYDGTIAGSGVYHINRQPKDVRRFRDLKFYSISDYNAAKNQAIEDTA